jgi:hypothetical protein
MPEDITMGELARRLDRIDQQIEGVERRLDQKFVGVHRQMESLQFVSRDAFDALVARMDSFEEDSKAKYRIHAGGLLTLTIALITIVLGLATR